MKDPEDAGSYQPIYQPTSILILDDHCIHANLCRDEFQRAYPHSKIDVAYNTADAFDHLNQTSEPYQVAIIDLHIVGDSNDGFDVLKYIDDHWSKETKTIAYSAWQSPAFVRNSFRVGASGYHSKVNTDQDGLFKAIDFVLDDKKYVSPDINYHEQTTYDIADHLTEREYQTFLLIGRGRSIKDIASSLNVTRQWVYQIRAAISRKLKVNTTDLLAHAVSHVTSRNLRPF